MEQIETLKGNLMNWLSEYGAKVAIIIFLSFLVIKFAKQIIQKALRAVFTSLSKCIGEKKRQETLGRITIGVVTMTVSTKAC